MGWCNKSAATINLQCNEIFTGRQPKKLKDFAQKKQVKYRSAVVEPSIPIHTLVKLVDFEDFTKEEIRSPDLPRGNFNVTSKVECQYLSVETYDPIVEVLFTQITVPNDQSKPHFRKYCIHCHKSNHSV